MSDTLPIDQPETGTDVAIPGSVTAISVFGTKGGVDDILNRIKERVRSIDTDISTPAGRKAIASLAYQVARSKTTLDNMGKELGEANYKAWKAITAERAMIESELDALRAEVRQPLTEWESAEKARVSGHEAALDALIESPGFYAAENTAADMRRRLDFLENQPSRDWQEFSKRAADVLANEIAKTKVALADAEKREAEAAEAARIAREKVEQERREHDERIAAAAAEKARIEAEERAAAEARAETDRVDVERLRVAAEMRREREAAEAKARAQADEARKRAADIERARQEAQARAERAEADLIAAEAKSKADAAAAAKAAEVMRQRDLEEGAAAERKRLEDERRAQEAEASRRAADRRHRAAINGEALADMLTAVEDLAEDVARDMIIAIAQGKIRHIQVIY